MPCGAPFVSKSRVAIARQGSQFHRLPLEARRLLADRLRRIAAESNAAAEWQDIARDLRRQADELETRDTRTITRAAVTEGELG